MVDAAAAGSVIPQAEQVRSWKSQPVDATGGDCPELVWAALVGAPSLGAAIAAVVDAAPGWTISKATRYTRAMWRRREELAERAAHYAVLKAAISDAPSRRADGVVSRKGRTGLDPTAARAIHTLEVSK